MATKNERQADKKEAVSQQVSVKKAFIATPIGPINSEIRRATDGLLSSVIKPVLESFGFECVASHEESDQGSISQRMIEHLLYDDLVLVNLTGLNANVMYELGIRHSTGKPVVLICENNTKLPFDMYDQRTIFYTDDMKGVMELKDNLETALNDPEIYGSNKYNPVIAKAKDNVVEQAIKRMDFSNIDGGSLAAELYDSIKNMSSSIVNISRRVERIEMNSVRGVNDVINKYRKKGVLESFDGYDKRITVDSEVEFESLSNLFKSHGVEFLVMSGKRGFLFEGENYEKAREVISRI